MLPRLAARALALIILAGLSAEPAAAQHAAAGLMQREWVDASRPDLLDDAGSGRPVRATIWYPVAPQAGAEIDTIEIAATTPDGTLFRFGQAAPGQSPAPGDHPLIALSHGNGGSAMQMMWLGQRLAEAGHVVVAANHHGNTAVEDRQDLRAFAAPWERSIDIQFMIDAMLSDPVFGPLIDAGRIGVGGFSAGGFSALAAAGATPDFDALEAFCDSPQRDATCDPQLENPDLSGRRDELEGDSVYQASLARLDALEGDPRIGAVFILAPAPAQAFTPDGTAGFDTPLGILAGNADAVAPASTNAAWVAQLVPAAQYRLIEGGVGHYAFLAPCGAAGMQTLPDFCEDAPGVDRTAIHEQAAQEAIAFFDRELGEAD